MSNWRFETDLSNGNWIGFNFEFRTIVLASGKPNKRSGSMIDSGFQDVLGQAKKMLHESPFHALRMLEVEQVGEQVMLKGHVDSFFLKQLAQETVRSATRGIEMINRVDVGTPS